MGIIKTATQGTMLKCKDCGRILIQAPHKLEKGDRISADWVVAEHIEGDKPVAGDVYRLTCICGTKVISLGHDYLVMED